MNNQASNEINVSEPITSLEHFPSLSEVSNKSRKTPRVSQIIEYSRFDREEFMNEQIPKKEKIHICKSIKEGGNCSYGKRCNSAHFLDELITKDCGFKDKCRKVKIFKDKVKNNDSKDICNFIHPSEDIDMYLERIGVDKEMLKRPEKNQEDSYFTKMCNSFFDKKECENKEECKYAHSTEQLKVYPCHFKGKCYLVVKNSDGNYIKAEGCQKLCYFLHDDEKLENYENRVINNMKKRETKVREPRETKVREPKSKDSMRQRFDKVTENFWDSKENEGRNTSRSPKDKDKDGIVLNVPVNMAMDMLDALLKSGNKNVQLNTY